MVAEHAEGGSKATPSAAAGSPKPPQGRGPPPSRRPVAHLVAAPRESTAAESHVEGPRQPIANPYGLSDDALMRKQRFDQQRAHKNSAVRAEIVLAPLDTTAASPPPRRALSARAGNPQEAEAMTRAASDEKESNLAIAELAAKARWKQLLSGVKAGDVTVVKRLLRDVRDLADAPSPTAVRSLLRRTKAGATEPYGSQRRPLHYASLYKQPNVVRLLLDHGADPNAIDKQGWSPLHCVALNGDVEAARVLLAAGGAPTARVYLQGGSDQGETPAAFARRHQQNAVAQTIERHAATTATVLAHQRLAWASAFHDRLGADSCVPVTLVRPSAYLARRTTNLPTQHSSADPGTSPTGQALQAVSRSVALGCLVDFPPDSLVLQVARLVPARNPACVTPGRPGPTHEVMLRAWMDENPTWKPSNMTLQELPWCD